MVMLFRKSMLAYVYWIQWHMSIGYNAIQISWFLYSSGRRLFHECDVDGINNLTFTSAIYVMSYLRLIHFFRCCIDSIYQMPFAIFTIVTLEQECFSLY